MVISEKGERAAGKFTSGRKGQHFSANCAMNASGAYFVLPRKNLRESPLAVYPPGYFVSVSESV